MSRQADQHPRIRPATVDDLPAVTGIYNHEVANSAATFDLEPSSPAYWEQRLRSEHAGDHLLVASGDDGQVLGYAYSSAYRSRPAYDRTRETSVYLDRSVRGRGVGRRLYAGLLDALADAGMHTAVALVALPNPASVALHESLGFAHVGTMREVGFKFERHIDTAWYQKLLEVSSG